MSEEEFQELNKRVILSGRQKHDYLIKSVLHQEIVVIGNQVQFNKLKEELNEILTELKRIESAEDITEELLTPIRTAVEIIQGCNEEKQ